MKNILGIQRASRMACVKYADENGDVRIEYFDSSLTDAQIGEKIQGGNGQGGNELGRSLEELKEIAKNLKIKGYGLFGREKLIAEIEKAQKGG